MSSLLICCVVLPLIGDWCSQVAMNMQCGAAQCIREDNFWLVLDTGLKNSLTYSPAIQVISLQLHFTAENRCLILPPRKAK